MFNKTKRPAEQKVEQAQAEVQAPNQEENAEQNNDNVGSSESLKVEGEKENTKNDATAYEFEFKFVDGMNEVEKGKFYGEGKNEGEAMIDARKKADAYSSGKHTVVFSGNFKKL